MNNPNLTVQLFLYIIYCNSFAVFSQSTSADEIYTAYDDLVGLQNTDFYNGPEFIDEYPNAVGDSRYFNLFDFTGSSIEYDGQLYSDVPLEYDIFSDNVISKSNDHLGNFIVKLIPEYISNFTIDEHRFVKLTDPGFDFDGNGFYEVLASGDTFNLYVKHLRNRKELTTDFAVQQSFTNENYFLVQYDGTYHVINSIKDFKKIVPDRYKEIQKFRKDYKPIFKSDIESFMKKLVEYLNGY